MVPSRQSLYLALLALSGFIAFTTAHFDNFDPDCPEDEEAPTSVQYLDASMAIPLDVGYFTNNSISLQYTNNVAALNWGTVLGNKIGTDVDVRLIVEKKVDKHYSFITYDSGRISFCKSAPKKVRSYIDTLLGFDKVSPPIKDCPYEAGRYLLTAYRPDSLRLLKSNIEKGQLVVSCEFSVNGMMIIRYTVNVIVS